LAVFTFTITARTAKAGETDIQERRFVVEMLQRAARQIGDGSRPLSRRNVAEPGVANPLNCSYAFGPGSINGEL
jgi:hypothetical protein